MNPVSADELPPLADICVEYGAVQRENCPARQAMLGWARAAMRDSGAGASIRVVCSVEMRAANQRWRGADYATNVLSFPADLPPELGFAHLGDILICADVVATESIRQGKSASAHWAHMVVHGMLHLQGYDHDNDKDAQVMESLETEILARLGFADPYLQTPGEGND